MDWDESLDRLFGLEPGATIRNISSFIDQVHAEDRARVIEQCRRCASEGADFELEFRVTWPDGKVHWLYDRGKTLRNADGKPAEMTGACVDITRRKHSEALLEERARISALGAEIGMVLTENAPLEVTLRRCCEAIVSHLQAAFARIWTLSEDGATLELQASAGLYTHIDGGHARVPVGKFKIGLIAAERKPHLTNDVPNDPRVGDRVWARAEGMTAFAGYPMIVSERLVGVVALFARRPLGSDTLGALASVSNTIALGIERKRSESAVAAGEARKAAILETALDCFVSTDQQSRILEFNKAAERTFGYSRDEVIGRSMPELIMPEEFRPRHYESLARYLEAGETRILGKRLEIRGLRADGTEFPMELAVNRIPSQSDISFYATIRDITERKEWEARLQRARADAEAASRAKSDFLASMSHELRTPLNAIIGYGEMLQEEADEIGATSLVDDLKKIHSAGRHLLSLINDVLDLSKIEAGRMELSIETFETEPLVQDVLHVATPLAARNGNTIDMHVADGAREMSADMTRVRQSLLNLVSNAAKFTSNGSISVTVEPDQADPDTILFRVTDTGIGLSPEQIADLFQPFQQVDSTAGRRFGGTGLGLALTRRFCRMMDGDVSAESTLGQGAVFTMRLPRVSQGPQPRLTRRNRGADGAGEELGTVLIVDDDPTACDLIRRQVTREGFHAVLAHDGPEALRLAREIRPALITLDVMMPGMDGWTVLTALKRMPDVENIPVVMLTMVDDRNLGYALGASEFLTKPIEREALAAVLRKYACATEPCRALVVDDEADIRHLLATLMQREGWNVVEAVDGREALLRVAESIPDLILLDLMMPTMDGFEFSIELRRRREWREIPVVVLTSKDLTEQERQRLNGHVQRVMTKGDYSHEELLQELARMARRCALPGAEKHG